MTDNHLQILLLEDRASEAELILRELQREGLQVNVRRVCTAADFAAGLKDPALDLILAACALPSHGGGAALEQARLARPETPVILITNSIGEDLASDALNRGATDYVLTPRLARLGPAVRRAMRELTRERQWRQAAVERDEAETRYRAERQRADLQLSRLNEVLRAVRDVNGLMGRERDPERLLAEACRIMVRTRGYRLVWIGRPDADSLRVVPVASAGPATDYLTGITVTCDESPTGRGPIGTAIRRRETCVCQDTAADPAFGPWREAALAHGFATVAAVPMLHAGHLFGAFSVYADQAGAFDGEELRLLEELAADLAFALESIESERERVRLQEEIALREQQLNSFFSSATAGLALLDKDLRFVRVNRDAGRHERSDARRASGPDGA